VKFEILSLQGELLKTFREKAAKGFNRTTWDLLGKESGCRPWPGRRRKKRTRSSGATPYCGHIPGPADLRPARRLGQRQCAVRCSASYTEAASPGRSHSWMRCRSRSGPRHRDPTGSARLRRPSTSRIGHQRPQGLERAGCEVPRTGTAGHDQENQRTCHGQGGSGEFRFDPDLLQSRLNRARMYALATAWGSSDEPSQIASTQTANTWPGSSGPSTGSFGQRVAALSAGRGAGPGELLCPL